MQDDEELFLRTISGLDAGLAEEPTIDTHVDILIPRSDEMTKDAIIAEIKKLTPEEQREIVEAFSEPTEEDYELSEQELKMVQHRLKRYRDHPETGISMEEMARRHGL